MKKFLLGLASLFFFAKSVDAAEILVKSDSIQVSGYSAISDDRLTVYGGIAGPTDPVVGTAGTTVDTCVMATTAPAKACNQVSVHSGLDLVITFQLTKDAANSVAKLYIDNGGGYTQLDSQPVTGAIANNTTVTLRASWSSICSNSGLSASCTGSSGFITKSLKFGVDSDATNDVEDAERKTITLKIHHIAAADTATQSYCPTAASGTSGMCNIAFIPGDKKVYIDSAIYAGNDPGGGGIDYESIAIFPVQTTAGSEATTMTNFYTALASPIFVSFNASDGTIPDSSVTGGGLENYTEYCFIYGTKNKAQNIYQFVNDAAAATTACKSPSEVVGVLEDKSCFISTAAFGSDMAPEVKIFRAFRNQFLLTNAAGKFFVKNYYKFSPPLASIIRTHEFLRAPARGILYPFLFFAKFALEYGLIGALLAMAAFLLVLRLLVMGIRHKSVRIFLLLLFLLPGVRADVNPGDKIISHESAKEGLVKITRDGTYVYDMTRPLKSEATKITFGRASDPDITADVPLSNGSTVTYNFSDFYSESSGIILGYTYEKYPWIGLGGKLGYQIGGSMMIANGNGILLSDGTKSAERFTFLTLPIDGGAVYRFEYKDKQILAPYVAGGGTVLALLEKRDDVTKPNAAFGLGFYGAGGVLLNISSLDPDSGFELESEYGISNLWFAVEFRVTEVNSSSFSFSNSYVNAGLSFDF